MKRAIYLGIMILLIGAFLTGCSTESANNNVSGIDVSLNVAEPTFNDQITITIDTHKKSYEDCIIFLNKPSGVEIPFTRSSSCDQLVFTPKSLEVLFDEGEGEYGIKVVGKDDSIITGMGYARFYLSI